MGLKTMMGIRILGILACGVLSLALETSLTADTPEEKAAALLQRMTLEEKIGQLVQLSVPGHLTGPGSVEEVMPRIQRGEVGSLLNVFGAEETYRLQKAAVENSRLGIPLLFALDVIHGYRTVFPIPLASAASWDLESIERAEGIAAKEMTAAGLHWTFAPMVDVARDPRWGRMSEGGGEDVFLNASIARARVRGFQGSDLGRNDTALACAKHFAGYGAAQAGRDYWSTDLTERQLRDTYLPPFEAAVDEGVATLMAAFNDNDGTPSSANSFLLDQVLRQEWGFDGFVVSDWGSVAELIKHGVAPDLRAATRLAFNAGVDMDMQNQAYAAYLAELVESGDVSEKRIDQSVTAILAAKFRLGLFEDPYRYSDPKRESETLLNSGNLAAARDLARRSCVLLKNEGVLPLDTGLRKVALIGPMADAAYDQLGAWHGQGRSEDSITLREGLTDALSGGNLRFAQGAPLLGEDSDLIAEAIALAEESDLIILVLGEGADESGEAASKASLRLAKGQRDLLRALHETGKPIVLVLMAGRPLVITEETPMADAILMAWHPGTMGGPAIADVLTGAYNPSGHLPVSWIRSEGQIPYFYAHKNSGRPAPANWNGDRFLSRYIDSPNEPLYPFGYGLSYTTFEYGSLRLSEEKFSQGGGTMEVVAKVTNKGNRFGETVAQLYVRDLVGSVSRPVRELKGFQRIGLAAGETKEVRFELRPEDLSFWRSDNRFMPEPGAFEVFVGSDANAALSARFELVD